MSLESVRGTPTVDGKAEALWESCNTTARVDKPHDGADPGSDNYAEVKTMWDDECIYFLVTAHDSDFAPDGDIFEFYLDEKYDKSGTYNRYDRQTRLSVSGTWSPSTSDDEGNDTGREELYRDSAYTETDDGWIMEVALKWSEGINPVSGDVMGLEFMWDDTGIAAWRWNVDTAGGDEAPYASTEKFAPLTLVDSPVIDNPDGEGNDGVDDAPQTIDALSMSVTGVAAAALIGFLVWSKAKNKR